MPYRDESERLRVRVAELEEELDSARQRIRELEGGPAPKAKDWGRRLFGGPSKIVVERELVGELDADRQDEVLEVLRHRFGVLGQASTIGRTLAWSSMTSGNNRMVEVHVTARDSKVRIELRERMAPLFGALYGGLLGGLGGGGMGLVLPLMMGAGLAVFTPVGVLVWLLGVFALTRALVVTRVTKRERQLEAAGRDLSELVERPQLRVEPAREGLRVADGHEHGADEDERAQEAEHSQQDERRRASARTARALK